MKIGHGFEIKSVAANNEGSIIASSCKSQTTMHSAIFLWNPHTCQIIDKLMAHNYTIM